MTTEDDDPPEQLPPHHSWVRSMMADARGTDYIAFRTLAEAREHPDSAVIFEGDYGGTIYLTVPVRLIACDHLVLRDLLADIDTMCWADPSGARVLYERRPVGSGVAGGMGGGRIIEGLWLHARLEALGVRDEIEAVLAGRLTHISTAGRRWRRSNLS
jgi:hypothetical protein